MSLSQRLVLRQVQAIELCGGLTESIFPQVEACLLNDLDYQKALMFVASRKDMERYKSTMDFLFCEIFVAYRHHCLKYYDDDGPQLREMISTEQYLKFSKSLLTALEVAREVHLKNEQTNWTIYRGLVVERLAA